MPETTELINFPQRLLRRPLSLEVGTLLPITGRCLAGMNGNYYNGFYRDYYQDSFLNPKPISI